MTEAVAKAFRREIDLGDGSGKQVFEADSAEELNDKFAEAQANATRKIAKQDEELKSLRRRVIAQPESGEQDPDGPMPAFRPRTLTADEKFALGQRLQNPATAADAILEAIEAGLGANAAQVRQALVKAETMPRQLRGKEAAEAFLLNHPEFVTNAANQSAIFGYMQHPDRNMALTVQNFEIAFGALSAAGLLQLRAPSANGTNGKEDDRGAPPADSGQQPESGTRPRFASTSVVTRGSGTPRGATGPKMPSDEEINKMSPAEYRRRFNDPSTGAAFQAHVERLEAAKARRA